MAPQNTIRIYIDTMPVDAPKRRLNGTDLRGLVDPPAERIWLDIDDAQDHPIADAEIIALEHDMRFFTDRARTIYIDKAPYQVRSAVLTEDQLRQIPTPPVPETHGIWKDVVDELDDPIGDGEVVPITDQDRFFTRQLPTRQIHVTVNRRPVVLQGMRHTGESIKEAAITQGVPIKADFLLSRKEDKKFAPVGDDEQIRVRAGDEFRALDGDDNS